MPNNSMLSSRGEVVTLADDGNWKEHLNFFQGTTYKERAPYYHQSLAKSATERQVEEAIQCLNKESRIGLSKLLEEMFTMVFYKLKDIERFRGNIHVAPGNRDTTAAHGTKVVLLGDDLFREIPTEIQTSVSARLRQFMSLSALMHDVGEIVDEFYSLAKKTQLAKEDLFAAERSIAEFSTRLALTAAILEKRELFYNAIDNLRAEVAGKGVQKQPEHAAKAITASMERFAWPFLEEKSAMLVQSTTKLLMDRYYDAAEKLLGSGAIVKILQRAEGEWYFQSVQGKDGTLPWSQATSGLILSAIHRVESPLGDLYSKLYREFDFEEQRALVEKLRALVYKVALAHIATMPDVISRRIWDDGTGAVRRLSPALKHITDPEPQHPYRQTHQEMLERQHREYSEIVGLVESDPAKRLRNMQADTIDKEHARLLYEAALVTPAYHPDQIPLVLKREIPEELLPAIVNLSKNTNVPSL